MPGVGLVCSRCCTCWGLSLVFWSAPVTVWLLFLFRWSRIRSSSTRRGFFTFHMTFWTTPDPSTPPRYMPSFLSSCGHRSQPFPPMQHSLSPLVDFLRNVANSSSGALRDMIKAAWYILRVCSAHETVPSTCRRPAHPVSVTSLHPGEMLTSSVVTHPWDREYPSW